MRPIGPPAGAAWNELHGAVPGGLHRRDDSTFGHTRKHMRARRNAANFAMHTRLRKLLPELRDKPGPQQLRVAKPGAIDRLLRARGQHVVKSHTRNGKLVKSYVRK